MRFLIFIFVFAGFATWAPPKNIESRGGVTKVGLAFLSPEIWDASISFLEPNDRYFTLFSLMNARIKDYWMFFHIFQNLFYRYFDPHARKNISSLSLEKFTRKAD